MQESLFNVTTVWELLRRLTHEVLASENMYQSG